jgi:hypothetical protein
MTPARELHARGLHLGANAVGLLVKAEGSGDKHGQGHGRGEHNDHHGAVLLLETTDDVPFGFICYSDYLFTSA